MHFPLPWSVSEPRTGGVALSSLLLAAPGLVVAHAGPSAVLVTATFVLAVALLEARPRWTSRLQPVRRPAVVARVHPPVVPPRPHWEVVERDGTRTLSMRWD